MTWPRVVVGAALVMLGAFVLANLVSFGYGRDQGIYSVVADGITHGFLPYRDRWDFKPPAIFFVYALARTLLGAAPWAVRVVESVALLSGVVAMCLLGRRHAGSIFAGLVGGVLFLVNHAQLEFWHTGQPESFGGVTLLWALVCVSGERAWRWQLAGALFACAGLLKPPLAGGALVVAVALWLTRDAGRWRKLLHLACGGTAVVAACVAWFAAKGGWSDLYRALFVFAPAYTRVGDAGLGVGGVITHTFLGAKGALTWATLAGMLAFALTPSAGQDVRRVGRVIAATIALLLVGVALQRKFFHYHYGAIVPLAALLAGWGFERLWGLVRRPVAQLGLGFVLLAALVLAPSLARDLPDSFWRRCQVRLGNWLAPERAAAMNDRLYSVADVDASANRRLATWLRAHTRPGDHVFVWGFEPVVYDLADRPPASRYIYDVPQRADWNQAGARAVLLADLAAHPPEAVAIEHGDFVPPVVGNRRDSAAELDRFPELVTWLTRDYAPAARVDRFDVHLRRGEPR
jgi:hypothetical protein